MSLMPLKDMLKSKSQSALIDTDPVTTMQKQAKQKQVRDKILATNDYEKMHPT